MSQAAQLFDPLAGSGADQDLHPGHLVTRTFPVNDIDADRWQNFLDDLPRADIKVPRWLMITGPDDPSWRSMDSWMPPKKHTKQRCICEREKIVSGMTNNGEDKGGSVKTDVIISAGTMRRFPSYAASGLRVRSFALSQRLMHM